MNIKDALTERKFSKIKVENEHFNFSIVEEIIVNEKSFELCSFGFCFCEIKFSSISEIIKKENITTITLKDGSVVVLEV